MLTNYNAQRNYESKQTKVEKACETALNGYTIDITHLLERNTERKTQKHRVTSLK